MLTPSRGNLAAQRAEVRAHKQRVIFSLKRFHTDGSMTARVLVGREYYDVDEIQIAQLQSGLTPDDLLLEPVPNE